MEIVSIIYLAFMFIALYMFFFFIILIWRNKDEIFDYPNPMKKYRVTVLTAAWNEEDTIKETIEAVLSSNYDPKYLEMIVIDDGSKDKTAEVVKKLLPKYKNLKLIINKENLGKAGSLNRGIKAAKGELIAVVDADSYPKKDSIHKLTGFFNDDKVGAVTSIALLKNRKKFFERLQAIEYVIMSWTRKLLDFIDAVYVTTGPLSLYRKKILIEAGGFDPKSVTEDIEITWHILDLGYKTKMCLDAIVYTSAPNKFKVWRRQRERWGIGGIQAMIKYKKTFLRKGMLGFFVIPFVLISMLLSMGVFLFGVYLVSRSLLSSFFSAKYSIAGDTALIRMQDLNLNLSILIFFTIVLFATSWIYSRFILRTMKKKDSEDQQFWKVFNRLFYLLVYLTLYPIIWFTAIYRVIRGNYKW